MKTFLTLAGSVLLVATLAACSPGINEGIGHRITFDSTGMVVHAIGKPDAHVGRDGSLAIGGQAIAVTPAQRVLLQRYYGEARGMMRSGAAVGKAGVSIAKKSVGNAIRHIFSNDTDASDKALDAQSDAVAKAADALCLNLHELTATQKQVVAQVPAFKPYDALGEVHCKSTDTEPMTANVDPSGSATVIPAGKTSPTH